MPKASKIKNLDLSPQQELFCRYYTQNTDEFFGNATYSYAEAYEYHLDELPDDDAVYSGRGKNRKVVEKSTFRKAYDVCSVEGNRLLRSPKINNRIVKLLNELMTPEFVDSELLKVVRQNQDYGPKVAAIREFNKLKQRITEKFEVTTPVPIFGGQSAKPEKNAKKEA